MFIIIRGICIGIFVAAITFFNGYGYLTLEGDFNPLGAIVNVVLIVVINVIVGLINYWLHIYKENRILRIWKNFKMEKRDE